MLNVNIGPFIQYLNIFSGTKTPSYYMYLKSKNKLLYGGIITF